MPSCRFSINISPDQIQDYYRGTLRRVTVIADNGQRLLFPASALQQYITHNGIRGKFEIAFSDDHKLIQLTRIG